MNALQAFGEITREARAAKDRAGDERISTEVKMGEFRVVIVNYKENGTADVESLTDFVSPRKAINFLASYNG